jgi:NADP-dependent aldehyde dehydrogenase
MMAQGQFCTSPGIWAVIDDQTSNTAVESFIETASSAIKSTESGVMLTSGIAASYKAAVNEWQGLNGVELIAQGQQSSTKHLCSAALFSASFKTFTNNKVLHEEVFGASALIVRCADHDELMQLVASLKGNLTASIHGLDSDLTQAQTVAQMLAHKVGRLIYNQMPTGVEVCASMNHGGPFPASTNIRSTSVGSEAIKRFQRPICYQNMPQELLPVLLKNA